MRRVASSSGMNRTDSIREPTTTLRSPRREKPELRRLAGRLRTLATEILKRVPDQSRRRKDNSAGTSNADDAPSPRKGYQWPASALTEDDMRLLHEIRSRTDKPIAILLHDAVSALHAITNSNRALLERLRGQTGRSIEELLGEAVSLLAKRHAEVATDISHDEPRHRVGLAHRRS